MNKTYPNVELSQQLRRELLSNAELQQSFRSKVKGEIHFFIRYNKLQKSIYRGESLLSAAAAASQQDYNILIPENEYKRITTMICNFVRKYSIPLEYLTLILSWEVKGKEDIEIELEPSYEKHFARM